MTIPTRITEEARKIAAKLVFEFETRVQSGEFNDPAGDQASVTLENLVLDALIEFGWAAEQRGREMEREPVAKWMIAHSYATGHGDTTVSLLAELVGQEREEVVQDCFARAHKHHRQAKEYEAQGDEDSQAICLTCAVEAMDIAAAIRSRTTEG